jgi:hypothetical protein
VTALLVARKKQRNIRILCFNWDIIILSFKELLLVKVSWQNEQNVVVVAEFMMALVTSRWLQQKSVADITPLYLVRANLI